MFCSSFRSISPRKVSRPVRETDKEIRLSLSVFRIALIFVIAVEQFKRFRYTNDDLFDGSRWQASRQKYFPVTMSTTS